MGEERPSGLLSSDQPAVPTLIDMQIRERKQSFINNFWEFTSLHDVDCLINEFEKFLRIDELELKVKSHFSKLSKTLNINKNNELDLLDYVKIFKHVENKISTKKFSMLLQVIKEIFNLCKLVCKFRLFVKAVDSIVLFENSFFRDKNSKFNII